MKHKVGRTYKTTRKVYEAVKKYDRMQFDEFCTCIYMEGYRDGADTVPPLIFTVEEIMEKIEAVKGIRIFRKAKIYEAIAELFDEKCMRKEET